MNLHHANTNQFSGKLARLLTGMGYREHTTYKEGARFFQRQITELLEGRGIPGCSLNDGKLHVDVYVYDWRYYDNRYQGVEITITVVDEGGMRWEFSSSLETVEQVQQRLDTVVDKLICAWAAVQDQTKEGGRT